MMAMYSVDDVLAYMEIPLPEEDDMSEDEFDGYIDQEEEECDEDADSSESDEELEGGDGKDAIPSFSGQGHCREDMNNKSPIDFLQLFLTDDLLHTIVEQTNLFADQFIETHELARRSRVSTVASLLTRCGGVEKVLSNGHHHGAHQLSIH